MLSCCCAKTDLFDEGLGLKFSHTTRKSTYPQCPVKLKSPSATKSKKTLRIASRMECMTEILRDLYDAW